MSETSFMTKSYFTKMVEEYSANKNTTYLESIIDLCDQLDIEPEDASRYISPIIKKKLEVESARANLLINSDSIGATSLEDVL